MRHEQDKYDNHGKVSLSIASKHKTGFYCYELNASDILTWTYTKCKRLLSWQWIGTTGKDF